MQKEGNVSRTWLAARMRRVVEREWRIVDYMVGKSGKPAWACDVRLGQPGLGSESRAGRDIGSRRELIQTETRS